MKSGLSEKGLLMMNKTLGATAKIFLEKGYEGTSSKMVAELLGVTNGSPFYHYGNKEGILLELVKRMFAGQFRQAETINSDSNDPLLLLASETALQMHIVELSEPLRDLYVTAYTLPSTSEYIHQNMTKKLQAVYGEYFPGATEEDFYLLELASAGVTRRYMALPCSETYPLQRKLRQYLGCCFRIYKVPAERYEPVIEQAVSLDLTEVARRIIDDTVRQVDEEFESIMEKKYERKRRIPEESATR